MIRRGVVALAAVLAIVAGTPWQVCHELSVAAANYWVWVLCEWDATWRRMGFGRRGGW